MFTLLVLCATSVLAGRTNEIEIDTDQRYCKSRWYGTSCDYRVPSSGTSCTIYVKNGNGQTESKRGPSDGSRVFVIKLGSDTSIHSSTWVWTSCSDALLIDRITLADKNNRYTWGADNHGSWCLSTDKYDTHGWEGYSGHHHCFRTLEFRPNDQDAWYRYDYNWTPGRRSLEGVPTLKDVQECEKDQKRDQSVCDAMVDKIFEFDIAHESEIMRPVSKDDETADDGGLAMVTSSTNIDSWAVYGLAGVGFAFLMVQGASWFKKQHQKEFTPLKAQDEL